MFSDDLLRILSTLILKGRGQGWWSQNHANEIPWVKANIYVKFYGDWSISWCVIVGHGLTGKVCWIQILVPKELINRECLRPCRMGRQNCRWSNSAIGSFCYWQMIRFISWFWVSIRSQKWIKIERKYKSYLLPLAKSLNSWIHACTGNLKFPCIF